MQNCTPLHAPDTASGAGARLVDLLEIPRAVGCVKPLRINPVELAAEIANKFQI
jgi:hypothetical protein